MTWGDLAPGQAARSSAFTGAPPPLIEPAQQLVRHQESTRLQYGLVERAVGLRAAEDHALELLVPALVPQPVTDRTMFFANRLVATALSPAGGEEHGHAAHDHGRYTDCDLHHFRT